MVYFFNLWFFSFHFLTYIFFFPKIKYKHQNCHNNKWYGSYKACRCRSYKWITTIFCKKHTNTRNAVNTGRREPDPDKYKGPSVKDMPAFDPDAEISSLTLTIPSWSSSIERTKTKADLSIVSDKARANLISALYNLQNCVDGMLKAIKEDKWWTI